METFSQRIGIKPKDVIQIDSMNDDLRNKLWNALKNFYWDQVPPPPLEARIFGGNSLFLHRDMRTLIYLLWDNYFKKQVDTLKNNWEGILNEIREYYFGCNWNEVYDFIEFIANNYGNAEYNKEFMNGCNTIFEQEISAYRFVGNKIGQITSETEITGIEEALEKTEKLTSINIHLETAIKHLTNRESPDYRNSIKESISAVEAICRIISNNPKAKLKDALKEIERNKTIELHPALKTAFSNLFGYTSDESGIRHSLTDEPNLSFEDAKFMLVSCSAFVNYLIEKARKSGVTLQG